MKRKLQSVVILVFSSLVLLVALGCGGEECDPAEKDACVQSCHNKYTSMSQIILHNECVYDCHVNSGCEVSCAGECYHSQCRGYSDALSYASCQTACKKKCD